MDLVDLNAYQGIPNMGGSRVEILMDLVDLNSLKNFIL